MSWSAFPFDSGVPSLGTCSRVSHISHYFPVDRQTESAYNPHGRPSPSAGFAGAYRLGVGTQRPDHRVLVLPSSHSPAHAESIVSVPASIRQVMAEIALASGRSESDLWTEAARAWLCAHRSGDEPLPPAPAAALPIPRCWDMVDDLLATLRRPPNIDHRERSKRAA